MPKTLKAATGISIARADQQTSTGSGKDGKRCGNSFIPADHACHVSESLAQKGGDQSVTGARLGGLAAVVAGSLTDNQTLVAAGLLTVGGALAAGVIKDTIEDRQNFAQFAEDRAAWAKKGVPGELKTAYDHPSKDLQISLLAAENRIKDNTYETLYAFDQKGNPSVIRRGGNASVALKLPDILKARKFVNAGAVVTHNHPYAGGTFSAMDISTAGRWGLSEIRATTGKEIYVLRPKDGQRFKPEVTDQLARSYQAAVSPVVMKSYGKFLDRQNLVGKIYHTTFGSQDKKLVREISADIEFDLHKTLQQTIANGFSDKVTYKRVPRELKPEREQKFQDEVGTLQALFVQNQVAGKPSQAKQDAYKAVLGAPITLDAQPSVEMVVKRAIAEVHSTPIEQLSYTLNDGAIAGHFQGDHPYRYEISPEGVFTYNEVDPLDVAHADSSKTCDRGKPCGDTCVARGYACNRKLSAGSIAALSGVRQALATSLSSKGSGGKVPFDQDPAFQKKLLAVGLTVGVTAGVLGVSALAIQNDLKQSSIPFDSIRQPPGGIPDAQTLAKYDTFQPGDLIRKGFVSGNLGTRQHYAVYLGKDPKTGDHMMIDSAEDWKSRDKHPFVLKRGLTWGAGPNDTEYEKVPETEMYQQAGTRRMTREEIVDRANKMTYQRFEYRGFSSNCESLARAIVEGKAYSIQEQKITPFTSFVSGVVTNNVLKVRTTNPWFPTIPGADFGQEGKNKLTFKQGGETVGVTGWSEYAFQKHRMTAQKVADYLENERIQDLRRTTWEKIPNPYEISDKGGDPREYAKYADLSRQYVEGTYKPAAPKPKETTLETNIFGKTLKLTLASSRKDAADSEAAVAKVLADLGLQDPEQYATQVETIAQQFPGIAKTLRTELYKNYLLMLFGTLNPPQQQKGDAAEAATAAVTEHLVDTTKPADDKALYGAFLAELRRVLQRSYTSGFDRFLRVDVDEQGQVSGFFQDKAKVVKFKFGKTTLTTELASGQFFQKDSWLEGFSATLMPLPDDDYHQDKGAPDCQKGIPCGDTCIAANKVCEQDLGRIARPGEVQFIQKTALKFRGRSTAKGGGGSAPASTQPVAVGRKATTPDRFEAMPIRDLKVEARNRNIYRYGSMTQKQLRESIRLADDDPEQQRRIAKTYTRNRNTPAKLRAFRLSEKSPPEKALTQAVQKWNRITRITQLAGVDPQLAGAAVGAVILGLTIQGYNRLKTNYTKNLPDSAASAVERATKLPTNYTPRGNVTFAVGGFTGEGSSAKKIIDQLKALGDKPEATDADKWFAAKHHFVEVDNREFDFPAVKAKQKNADGTYNPFYLAEASNKAFGAYLKNYRRGRNDSAIDLAAQLFAYGNRRDVKTGSYTNKRKTINVVAHSTGGNTAYEAMEILARMSPPRSRPGREILAQVNLVTLGTADFGYTERGLVRERNITSAQDPFSFLPQRKEKWISTVKGHEIKDYVEDPLVQDQLLQAFGYYQQTSYQREMFLRKNKRDAAERLDAPDCRVGKPCGNACIPSEQDCKKGGLVGGVVKVAAVGAIGVGAASLLKRQGLLATVAKREGKPIVAKRPLTVQQAERALLADPDVMKLVLKKRGKLLNLAKANVQAEASQSVDRAVAGAKALVGQKAQSLPDRSGSVKQAGVDLLTDPEVIELLLKKRSKLLALAKAHTQRKDSAAYQRGFKFGLERLDVQAVTPAPHPQDLQIKALLKRVIATANSSVAQVLSAQADGDNIVGRFVDRKRRLFNYSITKDKLSYNEAVRGDDAAPDKCVEGTPCQNVCIPRGHKCETELSPASQKVVALVKETIETEQLPSRGKVASAAVAVVKQAVKNPVQLIREGNKREQAARQALQANMGVEAPGRMKLLWLGMKKGSQSMQSNPELKKDLAVATAGFVANTAAGAVAGPVGAIAAEVGTVLVTRKAISDYQALQRARANLKHDEAFQAAGRLQKLKMLHSAAVAEVKKTSIAEGAAGDVAGAIVGGSAGTLAGAAFGPLGGIVAGVSTGVTSGLTAARTAKKLQEGESLPKAVATSAKEVVSAPVVALKQGNQREAELRQRSSEHIRAVKAFVAKGGVSVRTSERDKAKVSP